MVLGELLDEAIRQGASDVHLAAHQPPIARIRGELVVLRDAVIAPKELEEMLLAVVSPAQRTRLAADLEIDLGLSHRSGARFRARYYVKHSGIAAVLRTIPAKVPSRAELGVPDAVWRLADGQGGLVIVAGPPGSGKTTTAAAMIDHINRTRRAHILTIESPIEFVHEPIRAQVTQREIPTDAPTFAAALRCAARENADVVLVGDLTTADEIELALGLAEGGVLVLTTVTASHVASVLQRLLGTLGVEAEARARSVLASAVTGIVVQHLLPAADRKGMLLAHEVLVGTETTAALIAEARIDGLVDAMKAGGLQGMQTLDAALERLVAAGKVTRDLAFERAIDKALFAPS